MSSHHSSSHSQTLSYQAFLDDLIKNSPFLSLKSLVVENDFHIDGTTITSEFAALLTTLQVPGPSDLFTNSILLGVGAQFTVSKQDITAYSDFQANDPTRQNSVQAAAVKMPNFMLDIDQKLDMSDIKNSRQVRSMMLEITALCHPKLRKHPNLVDLMAWGSSTLDWQEVPFIALEIATMDFAGFLRNQNEVSLDVKHCLVRDIACGLDAIHEVGLVHGDMKPENVLIFGQPGYWTAKLTDFGGAANLGKAAYWEGGGTIGWRAPEVRELYESGKSLDPSVMDRIDGYSFGLVLWSVFLKQNSKAPHDETEVDVERIAFKDLDDKYQKVSASLTNVLGLSFSSLLKLDPHLRSHKIEPLLGDRSDEENDWVSNQPLVQANSATYLENRLRDGYPDQDLLEFGKKITDNLKIAFKRNEGLSSTALYALVISILSQGPFLDSNIDDRNLLLDLLCAAARQGHRTSRSIIFRIYDYFESPIPLDISAAKLSWIAESVSAGAFFLRPELQRMDAGLYDRSVISYRNSGKLHFGCAMLSSVNSSGVTSKFSRNERHSLEPTDDPYALEEMVLQNATMSNLSSPLSELQDSIGLEHVSTSTESEESLLYQACMVGSTSKVLELLSRGANASVRASKRGPGCLHWMFQFDPNEIEFLLDKFISHGASVHIQSKQKIDLPYPPFVLPIGTALHWAVDLSVPQAVAALLRNGADPYLRDSSDPYAYDENVRHLDRILPPSNTAFSIAERPTTGLNAFDLAVQNHDHSILNILFSNASLSIPDQLDEEGYSALHRLDGRHWLTTKYGTRIWKSCLEGSKPKQREGIIHTVNLLCDPSFELDRLSKPRKCARSGIHFEQLSALMMAIRCRSVDAAEALIKAGEKVECIDDGGRTGLHKFRASYRYLPDMQSAMITALLQAKPNVNIQDMHGDSPLAVAASLKIPEVGFSLLKDGADICARGSSPLDVGFGQNVLAIFCSCNTNEIQERDDLMAMILARFIFRKLCEGNDRIREEVVTNAGINGGNLLHFTARNGLETCCRLLLEERVIDCNKLRRGQKIRYRDKVRGIVTHHRTPLDEALKWPKRMKRWSDFSEKDTNRFLLVYDEIVKLLRAHGGVSAKTFQVKNFEAGIPSTFDSKYPNDAS